MALAAAAAAVFAVKLPTFDNFSNLQIITSEKGYLLSFASFIKMGRVKTPEGYTAKRAEEILETALDSDGTEKGLLREAGDRYPNLIVIMNETLADLPAIYGFETDTDVFPNIHSMDNERFLHRFTEEERPTQSMNSSRATAFISCLLAAVPMSSIRGASSSLWPGS